MFLYRLQPPKQDDKTAVQFKPGAATWNTDDPSQAPPWVRAKARVMPLPFPAAFMESLVDVYWKQKACRDSILKLTKQRHALFMCSCAGVVHAISSLVKICQCKRIVLTVETASKDWNVDNCLRQMPSVVTLAHNDADAEGDRGWPMAGAGQGCARRGRQGEAGAEACAKALHERPVQGGCHAHHR